jgi:thiamine-monophosphate kinase
VPAGTVADVPELTIADLGEDALLERLFPVLPFGSATLLGPGDDAAVLAVPDGRVVVTTDVLVEGRHFRLDWSDGVDVGWRAAVQNLADVAAMGARPTALLVALVVPPDLPVRWVVDLASGLAQACPPGVGVVGGDLSGGAELVVSVTALGDLEGRAPVRRSGARAGDVVAHAGVRGRSAAGYALLAAGHAGRQGEGQGGHQGEAERDAVLAYLRPVCPLQAGVVAATGGATAMLDVSDGLLRDAGRLARASGVVVRLDEPEAAFPDDWAALAGAAQDLGVDPAVWVLTGGEDHGLLATFPPGAVPAPFRVVGEVTASAEHGGGTGAGTVAGTVLVGGALWRGSPGWDHFRDQPRR